MKRITNKQMAQYWEKRVTELEKMRPITQTEARCEADRQRQISKNLTAVIERERADQAKFGARIAPMSFGLDAQRILADLSTDDYSRISNESEGTALEKSLAEARQRAEYYTGLAGAI